MTIDSKLEIRKLPPSHVSQLASILEFRDQWKKLMAIVPNILAKDCFECSISCENPAKYNSDHIRLIETASHKYKRAGTEILLDEWGCSGRIRPAVGHLLYLLVKAELFRAADYVAEKILHRSPPQRPSQGPAAPISVNINKHRMEEELAEISYQSSLLENIPISSFNNNLDYSMKTTSIPKIIVTPDADETPGSPNFNRNPETDQLKKSDNMIEFSSSDIQNGPVSLPNLSDFTDSYTVDQSDADTITTSESRNISSHGTNDSQNQSTQESNVPNLSELIEESQKSGNIPNLSNLNAESEDNIPNLSVLNQESDSGAIPNLSALNQYSSTSVQDESRQNTTEMHSSNIPNLSELISENVGPENSSDCTPIHNASSSASDKIVSRTDTDEETTLPNLSVLIPETPRRLSLNASTNTLNSSRSRQCTSPLPNLTLNTHLPHFAYHELEAATNNFNEEPFKSLDQLGRFLGAGAFGKVFLATNLLNTPVAVKKILLENVEVVNVDDTVTRQFRNEVEVLSRFRHRNLLSLLGYSCDGCTYCLMYEYISGGTLKDRLQNSDNKLDWQERLAIAIGTAKSITYLHTAFSSPLIHRDIKTANILLDCSNKPKLGDFGITKLLDNQNTNTCTVIGTSAYMAPEALRGDISVKCDTFSFGVVLLELLTSLPPFDENRDGNDLVTHVEDQCESSIQPLLDVTIGSWEANSVNFSEELYSIATRCLEEKKKRPIMVDITEQLDSLITKLQ